MRVAKLLIFSLCMTLLTGILASGPAAAGELSRALETVLAAKNDDAPLKVLVVLRDQVDVAGLDLSLHEQATDLATRHVTVIQSLQDNAANSQTALLADLEARLQRGEIAGYHAHWIINGVMVTARERVIREIAARDDVDLVEPDLVPRLIEPVKRYADNADKDTAGIGITPGVVNIGARRVWNELGIRGEGALIGSLDTGVDGNHPALADRWRGNHAPWQECWLDVVGSPSQFPSDPNDHGTHCTGTMTGLALDDTIGVAPGAEWIAANAINQGAGGGFDSDIITCFEWFADPDGNPFTTVDVPDVVQNSWGVHEGFGYPDCDSRWWAVIDACEAAGAAVVWAAGNEGPGSQSLRSPPDRATTLYNCFAVGATGHSPPFNIAGFSSRGPAGPNCGPVENRTKPEVSAPGVSIYSARPGGGYQYMDGTSMACPHVCGVIALMRSANPDVDVITMKQVLMETATDLGTTGEDNVYGHGIINAFAAVQAVMTGFGTVQGTVTDRLTGLPIADAAITVVDGYQSTVSDENGDFSLLMPAGLQTVQSSAFGYEDRTHEVELEEDQIVVVGLDMNPLPTATVSGVVYLPGGNPGDGGDPAAGAIVLVKDTPVEAVITDGSGGYSVTLPAGSDFELQVSAGTEGALNQIVPFMSDLELDLYLDSVNGEGFETGNMEGQDWYQSGGADWYAQSTEVFTGAYAARSGAIGNTNFSQMQVFVDCGDGGEITFWYKVSCASGDFLRFYIGNDVAGEWSGDTEWARFSAPTGGGVVSFRWRYQKNSGGVSGEDCAWVDDIAFPGGGSTTPQIVAAPQVVAVELDEPGLISAPAYLFNMGGADLIWAATESADWLNLAPGGGTVVPGSYAALNFEFDATGLPEGEHTTQVVVDSNDADGVVNLLARLVLGTTTAAPNDLPQNLALLGAVPNPFNPMTTVQFTLPATQLAQLDVYDIGGRLVRSLVDDVRPAGLNTVTWDGRDDDGRGMASGTYFARLVSGAEVSVKSMVLVR